MIDKIGAAAGTIWKILDVKESPAVITELRKEMIAEGVTGTIFDSAIGWLARENRLEFSKKGKSVLVALKR